MKSIFFNNEVLDAEKKIMNSLGIPSILLMENAGINSAAHIISKFKEKLDKPVIILTGKGNNAGDGFVISRHLAINGFRSHVLMLYPPSELKGDAQKNFEVLKNLQSNIVTIADIEDKSQVIDHIEGGNQIILDAVFGVGFKGELEERIADIFRMVNDLENKTRVSIDIPSGLESYSQNSVCFKSEYTISMGVKKFDSLFYSGKETSGKTMIVGIGVPDSEFDKYNSKKIFEIEKSDITPLIPKRNVTSYKYSGGKTFVLAGATGYTGAAYLASQSALRSGSGAVILGVPSSLMEIMEKKLTDVVKFTLPETNEQSFGMEGFSDIAKKIKWSDTAIIGPGLSRNNETMDLVRKIINEIEHNYVIDADGLYALNGHTDLIKNSSSNIILTPHFGEFASLLNIPVEELKKDFYTIAKDFAAEYSVTLVLKNAPTVITDGKIFYINSTGHQNLATVGTGDVLSGIIGSIFSQNMDPLNSSIAGTYIHGFCGDILYEQTGDSSTIASDLIPLIPKVKHYLSC
jgi:ADP-dependent NAD(P)H-hydrate dehydratase / NAD(P)H-hydrate epimerase